MFKVDLSKKGQVRANLALILIGGLEVVMRPIDAPAFRATTNEARRQYFTILKAYDEAKKAGDDLSSFRNLDDVTVRGDLIDALTTIAFATQGLISWNVEDQDTGKDVPPTPDNIDWIFTNQYALAESLQDKYIKPYEDRLLEKNASAPAPTGTSAGVTNTAKGAGTKTRRAAKAKKAKTAKSAPTKNTN
ncbi:MAG: hypothetical protein COB49_00480 [Alphaproteobacteria bacterium]|nr:MAG: hypothetical protein COB49_00480 [Alphaproteobacteria bacterium]